VNAANIQVVVDSGLTPVLYHNYTVYDNETHRWIYFSYGDSTHRIDIIPEFPPCLIMIFFMTITLAATVVCRRKRWANCVEIEASSISLRIPE
jgi:hypothetical protein